MGERKADRIRAIRRRAGMLGGLARAARLSPERRSEIAGNAGRIARANQLVIVRRHPITHAPTCLPLPAGVTPHLDGPYTNAAAVTRAWIRAERRRMLALIAQAGQ